MYDNTMIKDANQAVFDYATTATRQTIELQTALFKDFVALNKKLMDLSPAKEWANVFTSQLSKK
jgi:hypothetical protein